MKIANRCEYCEGNMRLLPESLEANRIVIRVECRECGSTTYTYIESPTRFGCTPTAEYIVPGCPECKRPYNLQFSVVSVRLTSLVVRIECHACHANWYQTIRLENDES